MEEEGQVLDIIDDKINEVNSKIDKLVEFMEKNYEDL